MKCPKCHIENPDDNKFCRECGTALLPVCDACGSELQPGDKFCGKCGKKVLGAAKEEAAPLSTEGERKHVTVLFSDLSGYTAMSEKLDPEDVKEITRKIYSEVSRIVSIYDGFIEKYAGDAVMALFGVPKGHEDDPIRAIKAAREIHECVNALSPEVENKIGQPISMHSGINTGLVITGEVDMSRGTHGVAGDTINIASRLGHLAQAGDILVDADTFHQAEGHFSFESLGSTEIKGKSEPVIHYKVVSPKDKPITIHRLSGVRANLVGRGVEMAELSEAVEKLHKGNGRIFSIIGDAGTGKSRLVEEFKATLDLKEIQWQEGHAYAYTQNIPYFPMVDLLNRVFHIEEGDPVESVREKVESGVKILVDNHEEVIPYVGGLYSLSYPEFDEVSPEFWKSRLQDSIQAILTGLAQRVPSVFFLEDLHWADPSFIELLRHACSEIRQPAIVLCVYRPTFSLFKSHEVSSFGKLYHEMHLHDLSRSESQEMIQSLLKTETVPYDLQRFVHEKMEGNPFYLEEAINTLIDSNTLVRENGHWRITKEIGEADISSTIQGVISARVDRLEQESKRILQEASVIGRSFYYEILIRITDLKDNLDENLVGLERHDLIKTKSIEPDVEYLFKHALTQEVVYNGLLKKDRKEIHERIGLIIEQLFRDRLPEFYETLAFHFRRSQSVLKAVDYLMKSGEKSIKKYAVEESNRYYEEAFELLTDKSDRTQEEQELLIHLFAKWALVFYYRGDFKSLTKILKAHEDLASRIQDKAKVGMYYAWLGFAKFFRGRFKESYRYLCKAIELGEEAKDQRVVGYACTWLPWTCAALGKLEEAITHGERAQEISKLFPEDQYLFFKSLAALGFTYQYTADRKKLLEAGTTLLDYGRKHSNIRCTVMGNWMMIIGHHLAGNFQAAVKFWNKIGNVAIDPFYSQMETINRGVSYFFNNQFQKSEESLNEFVTYSRKMGCEALENMALMLLGVISITKGHMGKGIQLLKKVQQNFLSIENQTSYAQSEYVLGKVYLQIVVGAGSKKLSTLTRNIGFILKNVPFADRKAEAHFEKAIETAKKIGAKNILAQAYLDLGNLHKAKKRSEIARKYFSEAIHIFEECEMEVFLEKAKEALESLNY